jgi:hypothetical protein
MACWQLTLVVMTSAFLFQRRLFVTSVAPRFEEVDDVTFSFSLEPSSGTGGTTKAGFDSRQFWCIFSLLGTG